MYIDFALLSIVRIIFIILVIVMAINATKNVQILESVKLAYIQRVSRHG